MRDNQKNIYRLAVAAMLAALIFIGTYLLKVPTPIGYAHLGDGFVFIAASMLPLPFAIAAAAIGAGLSDLLAGYLIYVPATVLIRVACALCFTSKKGKFFCARNFAALGISVIINAVGYYLYESVFISHNFVSTLAEVPMNIAQSVCGCVIFIIVGLVFDKNSQLRSLISKIR